MISSLDLLGRLASFFSHTVICSVPSFIVALTHSPSSFIHSFRYQFTCSSTIRYLSSVMHPGMLNLAPGQPFSSRWADYLGPSSDRSWGW